MEVMHALLGVVEQFSNAPTNPLFTLMVFAWSLTEVIRYLFYASALLGHEPPMLTYLRYMTFCVLYPLGAGSEAFLSYSMLPSSNPLSKSWISGKWGPYDYFRGVLFIIWWPGLYVMYTHMMKQRRKIFGGQKLGSASKKTN
ncbi:protein tyrosine phosphatase [Moniliophthora roreri MCA 2997]|uniref:Very-long-chain (3R)-3-hydroxyacyl-CoA dehydratase n=1 Tax=Moniliophthora roreri (strain MCA 2997) TaxID=1381753 RepID=V2X3R6_MONRO|nr:protein tyrosine phosphatase [Moniliophthora roreri MCA 2997]